MLPLIKYKHNKMKRQLYKLPKTVLLAIVLLTSGAMHGQNNAVEKYYSDYAEDDRFTKVSISSKMFNLFTNFNADDPEEQQVIETISKLKGLKILVGSEISETESESIYKSAVNKASNNFEELMTVENAEQEMIFYISEADGTINELLMLMYEGSSVMILSLVGDIDLHELSELSGKMEIEGFEEFKNLK